MRWPPRRRGSERDPDPAASMALLQEVLDRPPDPGYESAAARRHAQGLPSSTSLRSPLLASTCVVLGLVFSVSALTLRTPDTQVGAERIELAERIEAANRAGDASAARIEELRTEVALLQERELEAAPGDRSEELSQVPAQVGATAVTGPGVVITLDDTPPDDTALDDATGNTADRVLAQDLQLLVNGLWASGAEAIAVNEQRLTSTAAIRFAGEAIIVDFRGLTRPYVVRAVGDPQALMQEVTEGDTGAYFDGLTAEYGIIVKVEADQELTLPAAERLSTRVATVVPPGTGAEAVP